MAPFVAALLLAPPSLVGAWVADPATKPGPMEKSLRIEFARNRTFRFKGFNTVGSGTYRVKGDALTFTATRRNGAVPKNAAERDGKGRIVEKGRAILLDMGGKTLRLVRAK